MSKHIQVAVFFAMLALSFSSIAAQHTIKVVTEEWPPYNYTNSEGKLTGIATQIVKEVLQEAELDYIIGVYSWGRAFTMARDNKNTLLYTVYKVGDRLDKFQWVCPLIQTKGVAIYALADREDIQLKSLNDAKQYTIGTIQYGGGYDLLMHAGFEPGKHIDVATDELANIRKLLRKRVDLIIQEVEPLKLRLNKLGLPASSVKRVYSVLPDGDQSGCMAFSKDTSKEIVDKVRKALVTVTKKRTTFESNGVR